VIEPWVLERDVYIGIVVALIGTGLVLCLLAIWARRQ
jgi:hypothetical protein